VEVASPARSPFRRPGMFDGGEIPAGGDRFGGAGADRFGSAAADRFAPGATATIALPSQSAGQTVRESEVMRRDDPELTPP
jgi:hypothetical protein